MFHILLIISWLISCSLLFFTISSQFGEWATLGFCASFLVIKHTSCFAIRSSPPEVALTYICSPVCRGHPQVHHYDCKSMAITFDAIKESKSVNISNSFLGGKLQAYKVLFPLSWFILVIVLLSFHFPL